MRKRSEPNPADLADLRMKIIGLGERSFRKSYYPELQERLIELERERERARLYLDIAGVLMIVLDARGRITLANRKATEILGYAEADLLGRDWFETFVPPRERKSRLAAFRAAMSGEIPMPEYREAPVLGRTGEERNVLWRDTTLRGADGSIEGVLSSGDDITEHLRAIEAVARHTAELEQAREIERLKAAFLSAVSHELRTPLTSIKGYAEFLEDGLGGPLSPRGFEYVRQIEVSCDTMQTLVEDLLDQAQLEAGTFHLTLAEGELSERIYKVAESLKPIFANADLALDVEAPVELLPVRIDARRIDQVLRNLLANAVKFTPAGGQVSVRAARRAGMVRCEIRDTGEGIHPADVPKLFRRFSQLDSGPRKGGSGLGLSICRSIVETHGGRIGVESEIGKGSSFWFELPVDLVPRPSREAGFS